MDKQEFVYYTPPTLEGSLSSSDEEPPVPGYEDTPPTYDEAVGGVAEAYVTATAFPELREIGLQNLLRGTIEPYPNFDVEEDVAKIRQALTSKDKDLIIQVMCKRSAEQRLKISQLYFTSFNTPLPRDIKDFIGTDRFGNLISGLSMPLFEFMSRSVHNSTDEFLWMCSIMFILSNRVRQQMANHFLEKYEMQLTTFIKVAIHSDPDHPNDSYVAQIIRVYETIRDESYLVEEKNVLEDVQKLLELRKNKGIKPEVKNILYTKSFAHIRAICQEYLKQNGGVAIHDLISSTFSFNKFVLLNIVNFAINPIQYFVSIFKTHGGIFTANTQIFNSVILLRSEVDLMDIKHEFQRVYKLSLQDHIRKKTSGYYKYALYELIGEKRSDKS